MPLSLAEHAISLEVVRGRGRVPPLLVEFSERVGGDVDVIRKPLIINPAGTSSATAPRTVNTIFPRDVTVSCGADEIAFPMTENDAVLDFCGPFQGQIK